MHGIQGLLQKFMYGKKRRSSGAITFGLTGLEKCNLVHLIQISHYRDVLSSIAQIKFTYFEQYRTYY